jgi:hypothetical protein
MTLRACPRFVFQAFCDSNFTLCRKRRNGTATMSRNTGDLLYSSRLGSRVNNPNLYPSNGVPVSPSRGWVSPSTAPVSATNDKSNPVTESSPITESSSLPGLDSDLDPSSSKGKGKAGSSWLEGRRGGGRGSRYDWPAGECATPHPHHPH